MRLPVCVLAVLGSLSALPVAAFDTGGEPIYQILPAIPIIGAALPADAPGFVTGDVADGKVNLRWGRLFRITDDLRVYGRFEGRSESFTPLEDAVVSYLRSPLGQFLAESEVGAGAGILRVMPVMGTVPTVTLDAKRVAAMIGPAACGHAAGAADWVSAPDGAALLAAAWLSETDLRMVWQMPVKAGSDTQPQAFDLTMQVAGVAGPKVLTCVATAPDSSIAKAPYPMRRDMIGRLKALTYYRLAVMQEAATGARPAALATGGGPAFSTIDLADPLVQAAVMAMQPTIVVQQPEPLVLGQVAARPRATGFLRPVENGLPPPKFNRAGFGAIRGEKGLSRGGGEGGGSEGNGG